MSLRKYFTSMAESGNIPEAEVVTIPVVSVAMHHSDVTTNKASSSGDNFKLKCFGNSNLRVTNTSQGVNSIVRSVGNETRGRIVYGFPNSSNQEYLHNRRLSHNRITAIGSSTVAIDNKIEQAMDLVKSHLMFAVREEVEVLKEQIAELIERNNQLEYENGILRAAASPETLAKLAQPRQQPPPSSSS